MWLLPCCLPVSLTPTARDLPTCALGGRQRPRRRRPWRTDVHRRTRLARCDVGSEPIVGDAATVARKNFEAHENIEMVDADPGHGLGFGEPRIDRCDAAPVDPFPVRARTRRSRTWDRSETRSTAAGGAAGRRAPRRRGVPKAHRAAAVMLRTAASERYAGAPVTAVSAPAVNHPKYRCAHFRLIAPAASFPSSSSC